MTDASAEVRVLVARLLRVPMTQKEIARAIGVCAETLSRWQAGKHVMSPKSLRALRRLAARSGV